MKFNCIDLCHNSTSLAKKVNFATLKKNGVEYAIFRSIRKNLIIDQSFEIYYEGAKEAGLGIGVYLYSYATTVDYAKKEANAVVNLLNKRKLDLPIFYDLEDRTQAKKCGKTLLNNMALEFKKVVEKAGYQFGLYCDKDYYKSYIDKTKFPDTPFWIAAYSGTKPTGIDNMIAWQYDGTVAATGLPSGLKCDKSEWYTDVKITTESGTTKTTSSTSKYTTKKCDIYGKIYNCNELNIRTGPGTQYSSVGATFKAGNIARILEKAIVDNKENGWGKTNLGWINCKYFKENIGFIKVICNSINLRSGPGTIYSIKSVAKKGDKYIVIEKVKSGTGDTWYRLSNGYYCSSKKEYVDSNDIKE